MRVVAVSDIHARPSGADAPLLDAIHDVVEEMSPDVFVIAGDLSERIDHLRENLARLRIRGVQGLYVAGNHDVWFEEDTGLGSLEKYSRAIGQACSAAGFIHLPDQSVIDDSIAFVGSMGWYDYSFRREDMEIPLEQYETKQCGNAVWLDYYNIDWTFTDREITGLFNEKLRYDLSMLPRSVEQVVYVSHHLPFRELTVYMDRLPWDFFSAYMGASSTGEILLADGRVVLTISGHSHIRRTINIDGITAVSVPLGYGRPPPNGVMDLAKNAVAEIVIGGDGVCLPWFVQGDICEGLPYKFT